MKALLTALLAAARAFFAPPIILSEEPLKESSLDRLHTIARSFINRDASPEDKASDEFGCAESLSNIIKKAFPSFVAPTLSTIDLARELDRRTDLFERTLIPKPGCVIISPRTPVLSGHCGVFTVGQRIISNDSKTGLMQNNYSLSTWIKEFRDTRHLRILVWVPI